MLQCSESSHGDASIPRPSADSDPGCSMANRDPANVPGRQCREALVTGFLPPTWEAWMVFLLL